MDDAYLDHQDGAPKRYIPHSYDYSSPMSTPKPKPKPVNVSSVGKLVLHSEMGSGVVIEDGGDILTVAFKSRGIKKVARNYLKFM